jgi:hypothetical protein
MFMIVSPDDCQVYEMKLKKYKKEINYIQELVAYASLDLVDNQEWNTNNTNMNLKKIDNFNAFQIHCFLTQGRMRFIIVHENLSEDSIKNFFYGAYLVYIKALLNPFVDKNTKIISKHFDKAISELMDKYL